MTELWWEATPERVLLVLTIGIAILYLAVYQPWRSRH